MGRCRFIGWIRVTCRGKCRSRVKVKEGFG